MRLNRYLAAAGFGARRKVEELIKAGKVSVNDTSVTDLATQVDPDKDIMHVDGQEARIEKKVYVLLNKPPGYITTAADERGRKTVLDLVKVNERIYPVGRLDKDSRGLLLLTNDGDLSDKLLHPRHKTEKVYIVKADGRLKENELDRFASGLNIDEKKTAPAKIKPVNSEPTYQVTITEGRKRQIRLMFASLGHEVLDLQRTKIGPLNLNDLKEGEWRHLREDEIKRLLD